MAADLYLREVDILRFEVRLFRTNAHSTGSSKDIRHMLWILTHVTDCLPAREVHHME